MSVAGDITIAGRKSGPNRAFESLARAYNLTAVIMAAVAADVVRALEFAAIAALGMRFGRDRMVAATHALAGRRGLSLGNGHCRNPFRCA
jgi:hypothetical protein